MTTFNSKNAGTTYPIPRIPTGPTDTGTRSIDETRRIDDPRPRLPAGARLMPSTTQILSIPSDAGSSLPSSHANLVSDLRFRLKEVQD
ncbi:hypothetical protein BDW59DRAFT_153803 [Aspergillus cavernicola]|uniref:Uncharacterized protein n=1 Tax=Aspergillus cavernicola TaxID=176166 RepID=A0ABR4HLG8_9EURO